LPQTVPGNWSVPYGAVTGLALGGGSLYVVNEGQLYRTTLTSWPNVFPPSLRYAPPKGAITAITSSLNVVAFGVGATRSSSSMEWPTWRPARQRPGWPST
jgi:hypothetical protein